MPLTIKGKVDLSLAIGVPVSTAVGIYRPVKNMTGIVRQGG
jgi:hypothetical protein